MYLTTVKFEAVNKDFNPSFPLGNMDVTVGPTSDYSFTFIAKNNCGYTISVNNDDGQLVCSSPTFTRTSDAAVTYTGKTNIPLSPDKYYTIKVTRIYGSTSAVLMKYNGTSILQLGSSGSGTIRCYGQDILFKSGDVYSLSLTLSAQ